MLILLTNDDGIYAPGLAALKRQLQGLGDVYVVAPATEQSGVAHSITYLTPLIVKEVFADEQLWGWAVEGSPADCVKIGTKELLPRAPDLVVSGINGGLNAGINVLYSGTVAAAIEGAFFGITSLAVSLEFDEHARFDAAARLAATLIEKILENNDSQGHLYNINIPTAALQATPEVRVVPMDVTRYGDEFERRSDPRGRDYYWATGQPPPSKIGQETDLSVINNGCVSLTPLCFDMTDRATLERMGSWQLDIQEIATGEEPADGESKPVMRPRRRRQPLATGPHEGAGSPTE